MKSNEFAKNNLNEGVGDWLKRLGFAGETAQLTALTQQKLEQQAAVGSVSWLLQAKQAFDAALNSGAVKLSISENINSVTFEQFDHILENTILNEAALTPDQWMKEYMSKFTRGQDLPSNYDQIMTTLSKEFENEIIKNPKMDWRLPQGAPKKIYDFMASDIFFKRGFLHRNEIFFYSFARFNVHFQTKFGQF